MAKVSLEKSVKYTLASNLLEIKDGKLYWAKSRKGATRNKPAGSIANTGYRMVYVDGVNLLAHRVVWFISKGVEPEYYLDHIDGDKDNNRIENLREVLHHQNAQNKPKNSTNSTGFKGVYKNTGRGKPYCAQVKHKGKKYYLGSFDTPEDAKDAYDKKAKELHGEFYHAG